jgi:ubiquinone/menaquinone biosynthesis C-methylase UbiE
MDYRTVTEAAGTLVTYESLAMMYTRYRYAAGLIEGKEVLEVACGSGQGLGYLARSAKRVVGGDCTHALLRTAVEAYDGRIPLIELDAQALPFRSGSFDVVLLYEAIYYLPEPHRFLQECRRLLRPGGTVILCSINPEWSDFNPSPYSIRYFTATELGALLECQGFAVRLSGAFRAERASLRAATVSVLKRVAVHLRLIPRTMAGKAWLKRLFLGSLNPVPRQIDDNLAAFHVPVPLSAAAQARFKVLFAVGRVCT